MLPQVVRPAVIFMIVMTILTGVIYPLIVTGISKRFHRRPQDRRQLAQVISPRIAIEQPGTK